VKEIQELQRPSMYGEEIGNMVLVRMKSVVGLLSGVEKYADVKVGRTWIDLEVLYQEVAEVVG